jgi:hypothetical protein
MSCDREGHLCVCSCAACMFVCQQGSYFHTCDPDPSWSIQHCVCGRCAPRALYALLISWVRGTVPQTFYVRLGYGGVMVCGAWKCKLCATLQCILDLMPYLQAVPDKALASFALGCGPVAI